jgi:ketosteroid isomerase-like protein
MHLTQFVLASAATVLSTLAPALAVDDARIVADLDTRFQLATKLNDAATIDEILHDDMVLVIGRGTVVTKRELVDAAKDRTTLWEQQDEEPGSQTVRLFGPDTAVVTAKLWLKGTTNGQAFDRKLWFSDTYVRTPKGWKYAFGQSSLALPNEP